MTVSEQTSQAIIALAGVSIGGLVALGAAWISGNITARGAHEGERYRQRLIQYQELWKCTQTLRRTTPQPAGLQTQQFQGIADELDSWYFRSGGLLMTDEARDKYFKLLEGLRDSQSSEPYLSVLQYQQLYSLARDLRDKTAAEVGGRQRGSFV